MNPISEEDGGEDYWRQGPSGQDADAPDATPRTQPAGNEAGGRVLTMERRNCHLCGFKLAEADQKLGIFAGYGAVFGNVDALGDVIEKGAFTDTLKEWKARGKYPPMLLQHGGMFCRQS